tara:strand:+ start:375 stop:539 length:165 start_codon:yes stop_codon:yes gene_type:complete
MFSKNDKITIKDPDNFYFGREAKVICGTDWPRVWSVSVADVYIAINQKFMEQAQ